MQEQVAEECSFHLLGPRFFPVLYPSSSPTSFVPLSHRCTESTRGWEMRGKERRRQENEGVKAQNVGRETRVTRENRNWQRDHFPYPVREHCTRSSRSTPLARLTSDLSCLHDPLPSYFVGELWWTAVGRQAGKGGSGRMCSCFLIVSLFSFVYCTIIHGLFFLWKPYIHLKRSSSISFSVSHRKQQ